MSKIETVKGKIIVLNETVQISEAFSKREIVLETDDKYPQRIPIEFTQDKCELLNGLKVGETIIANVNIGGRCWNNPKTGEDKYFLSLHGWKVEKTEKENYNTEQFAEKQTTKTFKEDIINDTVEQQEDDSELPF